MKTILFILTSAASMNADHPTGLWFAELADPYYVFQEAGYEVALASPKGGEAPVDANSLKEENVTESVTHFQADETAMAKLTNTKTIKEIDFGTYAGIFLPGGHGAVIDLPQDQMLADKLGKAFDAGTVIGAVCHGPGGLVSATRADGKPIVAGLRVNSFTNAEEEAVGLTDVVPFLLETRLKELGGHFEGGENFTEYAVRDGNLVTGQNPQSSVRVANLMIEAIEE